jgi:hypothetical protein
MRPEFDPGPHVYRLDGRVVRSVTQVIKAAGGYNYDGVPAAVLKAKARLGTAVHAAIARMHAGAIPEEAKLGLGPEREAYFDSYLAFLFDTGYEVDGSEERYGSLRYGYAGTLDSRGWLWEARTLLDVKCTAALDVTCTGAQTAAYEWLLIENDVQRIDARYAVRLTPDARRPYELRELDDPRDWQRFHRWLVTTRGEEETV